MADKKKGQEVPDTAKFSPEEYLGEEKHKILGHFNKILCRPALCYNILEGRAYVNVGK